MSGRFLSAAEIVKIRSEAGAPELPQGGGAKVDTPDDSWLQKKKLEVFHEERLTVLEEERIHVKGSLTTGEWRPDLNKLELTSKPFHQFWKVMGHHGDGKQWLFPEEALFLADEGVLQVCYGGIPWSVQQTYMAVLGSHVLLEHYQVYSHLCRLGYIVQRHTPVEEITEYERTIGLDKYSGKKRRNVEENSHTSKKHKNHTTEADILSICVDKKEAVDGDTVHSRNSLSTHSPQDKSEEQCVLPTGRGLYPTVTTCEVKQATAQQRMHTGNFDAVEFPNLANEDSKTVTLQAPSAALLPSGVSLSEGTYTYYCAPRRKFSPGDAELEYSVNTLNKPRALNWQEWKKERQTCKSNVDVHGTPAEALWQGDVTPLLKPSEAFSNDAVLSKLRIIREDTATHRLLATAENTSPSIVYDVYLPNTNFKKSNPGLPNIRICVTRQEEMAPSLSHLLSVHQKSPDGVPLQWAVVDNGDIAFYSFNHVNLPIDVSSF